MDSHGIFTSDDPVFHRGSSSGGRRPNYRRGGRGGRDRGRGRWKGEFVDDDGDINMDDRFGRPKFRGSNRRPSVFNRLGGGPMRARDERTRDDDSVFTRMSGRGSAGHTSWHKVTITKGANEPRDWLMMELQKLTSGPFQPIQVHVLGDKVMFFVEDPRVAKQLKGVQRIEAPGGSLLVSVRPSPPPRGGGGREGGGGGGGGSSGGWFDKQQGGEQGGREQRVSFRPREGFRSGPRPDGDAQMEEDMSAVLLQSLAVRFETATRSLNLSDMFNDQVLQGQGVRAKMSEVNFVSTLLSLIGQHCPDLQAMDLSNNRIHHLDMYKDILTLCPNIQVLNLSCNQINSMAELEKLQGMNSLTTLVMDGNPACQRSQHVSDYLSKLRDLFPALQQLDGQQLPEPVKFDLPIQIVRLPPILESYLGTDEVKGLVITFLEQYYKMFDGDPGTRGEQLLEAYCEESVFSLCVNTATGTRGPQFNYINQSRNLLRVSDSGKRMSLLMKGRIDIVHALRSFPHTSHLSSSFRVDVMLTTPTITAFVVYGLFSEGVGDFGSGPFREFTRTFILASAGNGVVIINDQFSVRNAGAKAVQSARDGFSSQQQQQQAGGGGGGVGVSTTGMMAPTLAPALPTLQESSSSSSVAAALASGSNMPTFANAEEDATRRLSAETGMNFGWSNKCLVENSWDYGRALLSFNLLQSQGKIPPEAFLN